MIRPHWHRIDWMVAAILLSASLTIGYNYFQTVDSPKLEPRLELHNQIINGTAASPYRYRVLVPTAEQAVMTVLDRFLPPHRSFLLAYAIYDVAAIFAILALLFAYTRNWFGRFESLTAVLFVASTMPIALRDHYYQPWSLLETALFTLALLLIYRQHNRLLAALVVIATLNRETSIFIPVAFLLSQMDLRGLRMRRLAVPCQALLWFALYATLWAVVFIGLRLLLGSAPSIISLQQLLTVNLGKTQLVLAAINVAIFLGAFWGLAILGWRYAPEFLQRMAWIIPLYLGTILIWGVWREVRLLMPLYPILIPLALSFVSHAYPDKIAVRTATSQ